MESTRHNIYDSAAAIPSNDVGLVLGARYKSSSGYVNPFFKYRMDAAIQLYKSGKIKHILVSGDNHSKDYDESTDMKEYLVRNGVKEDHITMDFAGFRTLDSIVRCKEIFGVTDVTIISQSFHTPRALFLAKSNGINAIALNAKSPSNEKKVRLREKLARFKSIIDVYLLHKRPKFLGEKEFIQV